MSELNNDLIVLSNLFDKLYLKKKLLTLDEIELSINKIKILEDKFNCSDNMDYYSLHCFLKDLKKQLLKVYALKISPIKVGDYICYYYSNELKYAYITYADAFFEDVPEDLTKTIKNIAFGGFSFIKSGKLGKKSTRLGWGIFDDEIHNHFLIKIFRTKNKIAKLNSKLLVSEKELNIFKNDKKPIIIID